MNANTGYVGCGYSEDAGTLCDFIGTAGNFGLPPAGKISPKDIWMIGPPCSKCPETHASCDGEGLLCVLNLQSSSPTQPSPSPSPSPASKPCPPQSSFPKIRSDEL